MGCGAAEAIAGSLGMLSRPHGAALLDAHTPGASGRRQHLHASLGCKIHSVWESVPTFTKRHDSGAGHATGRGQMPLPTFTPRCDTQRERVPERLSGKLGLRDEGDGECRGILISTFLSPPTSNSSPMGSDVLTRPA